MKEKTKLLLTRAWMLAPARPRHIGIQLAAALMFACTVMNLTFFIKLIDELWTAGHHHARLSYLGKVDCVDCVFLCDLHQDLFLQSGFKAEDCSSGMVYCPCHKEGGRHDRLNISKFLMRGLKRIRSSLKVSQI